MALLLVTQTSSSNTFSIDENDVFMLYTKGAQTVIEYIDYENGTKKTQLVDESAAAVYALATKLVSTTMNGGTVYLNADKIFYITEVDSLAVLSYDGGGDKAETLNLDVTEAAFLAAIPEIVNGETFNIKKADGTTIGTVSGTTGRVVMKSEDGTGAVSSVDVEVISGEAESAVSGAATFGSGNVSTAGKSGDVTIISGDSPDAEAGNIDLFIGEGASTTVKGHIKIGNGYLIRPTEDVEVDSGNTITGVELAGGYIAFTGATGSFTLPTAADLITAFGDVVPGAHFDFSLNTADMDGSQVATVVLAAGITTVPTPIITGTDTLTIDQDAQGIAQFRILFDTTSTAILSRIL